ncbi:DNA-methyltransferase [Rhodomicrobium lacus]|uniref:DNA-methyltransferase n=1 Tax=Rhodomicrobium lacus TaxID=2498452 RepID=UPI000F8E73AF|nr:site-specific DNA-methyltransferase [Rhodomicrobium lacus]
MNLTTGAAKEKEHRDIIEALRERLARSRVQIGPHTLYNADCRLALAELGGFDAVITDPPYSSGGSTQAARNQAPSRKYRFTGTKKTDPDFGGDNRDQRSLTLWCSDWMAECLRATRQGGALMCFIDWRNLPAIIDACQVGGWVYRGIVPWDKTEAARPNKGWFRTQVEYIVTATAGPITRDSSAQGICQTGYIRTPVIAKDKHHITGKPVTLMQELLRTRDDWQNVLDPFMGSGTTGVACVKMGRIFTGIEFEPRYFDIACRRIEDAMSEQHAEVA